MTQSYSDFLQTKELIFQPSGFPDCTPHPTLYPWQADIVRWAVKLGRAAIFADCGLGKSLCQLAWALEILRNTGGRVLIVAPLSVAEQTIGIGKWMGIAVTKVKEPGDSSDPITITNYERLSKFNPADYVGLVCDESSILKSIDGKTRKLILEEWTIVPYRLACTATPAPNDLTELANHSQFVGALPRQEMLATFFVHDEEKGTGGGWRLKGHAAKPFYRWLARWSVFVRLPSDLGYPDDGYVLPPLSVKDEIVRCDWKPEEQLFAVSLGGVTGRTEVRRNTLLNRVEKALSILRDSPDQWLVWCNLNEEQDALKKALGEEAVSIQGKDSEDAKIKSEFLWRTGSARVLITKPKIFGFGMNWQHCHKMLFLGLGDSYEAYYQAIRRCYRFGQKEPVDVRIVISDVEGQIANNVRRKEEQAQTTAEQVVSAMRESQIVEIKGGKTMRDEYKTGEKTGENGRWKMLLGDCVEQIRTIPSGTVGLSVFSPPFAGLYTYSASEHDMGNSRDDEQFFHHFDFLISELLRVTMDGRRACVHVQQLSSTKVMHGVIGWRDFRGEVVKHFIKAGWVYDGEVVIDKDPQAQAIRTRSKGLMFATKERDSSWLRPAMADYILLFRHPEENKVPIKCDVTNDEWISWARPIWYNIKETETLQHKSAREAEDEKHIAPLQLETIERCIRLWSNPDDLVLSPFAGIGSEGYQAVKLGRQFVGIELKESYYKQACRNIQQALSQGSLFGNLL